MPESVQHYLQSLPADRLEAMTRLRELLQKNLPPGFEETLQYGMISYVVPHSIYPKGYHCKPSDALPFISIASLAPKLNRLLQMRRVLGLRNSTHTLVKIMQPFAQPALRLVSYTHPEYLTVLTTYFSTAADPARGDIFLMRGTEGETVANAKRANAITWFHDRVATPLVERQAPVDEAPPLPPASDAQTTAEWVREALQGRQPVPAPVMEQVAHCLRVSRQLAQ
jgi:anthranilate phosphoribosyltransferase